MSQIGSCMMLLKYQSHVGPCSAVQSEGCLSFKNTPRYSHHGLYNLPTYHTLFVKFHRETPVSTRNHTGSSDSPRRKKNIRKLRTYKLDALRKQRRICQPRLFHDLDLGRVSLIWMRKKNHPPQIIIQWHSPS